MTREKAHEEISWAIEDCSFTIGEKVIDEIYDAFESRTCENCKLLNRDTGKSYSTCTELPLNMGAETITEFGCNKFEEKKK